MISKIKLKYKRYYKVIMSYILMYSGMWLKFYFLLDI